MARRVSARPRTSRPRPIQRPSRAEIAKGGSYQYGGSLPYTVSLDNISMTGLPYKARAVTALRLYVFGEYVDQTHIDSQAELDNLNNAHNRIFLEALRPYINGALRTW